ncbi:MAG: carboxypeptidase regulatory-like domain-containing protein [Planctomycetota bacterium]
MSGEDDAADSAGEQARLTTPSAETAPGFAANSLVPARPEAEPMSLPPASLAGHVDGAAALQAAQLTATAAARVPTTIVGRAVDPAGRPIEGAKITFVEDPFSAVLRRAGRRGSSTETAQAKVPELPFAMTDRQGQFRIETSLDGEAEDDDLPFADSRPTLVATNEAFATALHPCTGLVGGDYDAGQIVLERGAWISGRVIDEAGRPLAGAEIRAQDASAFGSRRSGGPMLLGGLAGEFGAVTTGSDGRFSVAGLAAGEATVSARSSGRRVAVTEPVKLEAGRGADVGDLTLDPGVSISGYVLDEAGRPLPGAQVSVSSMARLMLNRLEDLPRQQLWQEFGQRELTGLDGSFEVSGLAGGNYNVHVQAEGCEPLERENVPAGTRDLKLQPHPYGGVLVRLIASGTGAAVPSALLVARPTQEDGFSFGPRGEASPVLVGAEALSAAGRSGDPAGAYFVRNAGRFGTDLVVQADGFATSAHSLPGVPSAAVLEQTLTLLGESVVEGFVRDAQGQPVVGASLTLSRPEPPQEGFSFGADRVERRFSRAVRAGDGGDEAEVNAERHTARSGVDGGFKLRGLSAGDWELGVAATGFVEPPAKPLTLADGASRRDLELVLVQAGAIAGLVLEANGLPAAGVEVTARSAAAPAEQPQGDLPAGVRLPRFLRNRGPAQGEGRARTDALGNYRIEGLDAGGYAVQVSSGPRGASSFGGGAMMIVLDGAEESQGEPVTMARVVAGADTRVDLKRNPRGQISGRVLAGGAPVEGVSVRMRPRGGLPFGGNEATTDARGDFLFEDVTAGEYVLSTTAPGAALEERVELELAAGQSQRADLIFDGATVSGRVVLKGTDTGAAGVTLVAAKAKEGAEPEEAFEMSFAIVTRDDRGGGGGMTMDLGGGAASQVRTDAEGRFELRYLKPGRYSIEARGGGYLEARVGDVEVLDREHKDDLKLEVVRGAVVEGQVRDGLTGARLDKVPVRLQGLSDRQMTVTADGRYRFEGLEAGDYDIAVLGSSFDSDAIAEKSVKLEAGEQLVVDLTTKS